MRFFASLYEHVVSVPCLSGTLLNYKQTNENHGTFTSGSRSKAIPLLRANH